MGTGKIEKCVNRMTVVEVPPASAVSFDKKRNINRMTVAEVPPASAVSFDKKRNVNQITVAEEPPASAISFDKKRNKQYSQPGDRGGGASGRCQPQVDKRKIKQYSTINRAMAELPPASDSHGLSK